MVEDTTLGRLETSASELAAGVAPVIFADALVVVSAHAGTSLKTMLLNLVARRHPTPPR
ncbi:MAG: hypothetical protein ACRDPT_05665 [Streptomycetales bacterium]